MKKIAFSIILMLFLISGNSQVSSTRPNILFIPIDDLRPELGCYGNQVVHSPHIDALAKDGVVFNRAYCQQAVCNPSRASVLTGLRPDKLKIWDLYTDFRTTTTNLITLPQYFQQNGYITVSLGKTFHNIFRDSVSWMYDLHVDGFPFDPDAGYNGEENLKIIEGKKQKLIADGKIRLDKYGQWYIKAKATDKALVGDDDYYDGAQTTLAIQQIHQLKQQGTPFFLSVGFYKPHLPFNAPQKYWDLYDREKIPLASNMFIPLNAPIYAVHGDAELRYYEDFKDLPFPNEQPLAVQRQRELLHGYYACVSYIDAQIGRLIATLKQEGIYENTIIVLWSDHGWKLGEHNSWAKQSNFEIDTRVSFIISGKHVKARGSTTDALVELLDIYPTLCDMANLQIPAGLQGKSLKPLLTKPGKEWNYNATSQFLLGRFLVKDRGKDEKMGYSLRSDRYRYTEWYTWENNKIGKYLDAELYDHSTDNKENQNISKNKENAKLIIQLSKKLHQSFSID